MLLFLLLVCLFTSQLHVFVLGLNGVCYSVFLQTFNCMSLTIWMATVCFLNNRYVKSLKICLHQTRVVQYPIQLHINVAHSATKNYWKYVCICIYVKMVRWHVLCLNFFIYVVYDITTRVYPTSNFSSYKLLLQLVLTANPTTIVYRPYVFVQRFHKFMSSSSVSAVNLVL